MNSVGVELIDGHWEGFYEMEGFSPDLCNEWGMQKFRVEAWLQTDGGKLTGRMVDYDRSYETNYANYYEKFKDDFGWIEARNAEAFIKENPDAMMVVNGCENSVLEGKVGKFEVHFCKIYQGMHETIFKFGNKESIERIGGAQVYYYGKLEEDGQVIKGTYKTVADQDYFTNTGYFELRKVNN